MSIDLDRITHPLRLATGSHEPGSGRGCALNALSFIMGEPEISDFPECTAAPLARMVQAVNDILGEESGEQFQTPAVGTTIGGGQVAYGSRTNYYLTAEDSLAVLDLAWSTVGTAGADANGVAVWAMRVLSNAHAVIDEAIILADEDLKGASRNVDWADADAKDGSYIAFALDAVRAIYGAVGAAGLLVFARDAIAVWKEINDVSDVVADPAVVNEAIEKMVSV